MLPPGDVLLTSVDIPAIAQVCEASEQAPFLALLVSLNLSDLPVLMQESGFQLLTSEPAVPQAVCPVTEALLSAVCRLVALLENRTISQSWLRLSIKKFFITC